MKRIFIDGKDGTTGLKIYQRFENRDDIELLLIDPEKRKDASERAKMINESDITFLCLPDAASIEAVSLVSNDKVKIIDTSTAHRTNPDWAYGFAELSSEFRQKLRQATELQFRVATQAVLIQSFTLSFTAVSFQVITILFALL